MGINTHVYTYWGVRTEYNRDLSEDFEEVYDELDNTQYLFDAMSCEYMVFGNRLYDSGDNRWGEMNNSNEIEINDELLNEMKASFMTEFKEKFPTHYDWLAEKPWKLVSLVHYS
jgi:hypothetical protein